MGRYGIDYYGVGRYGSSTVLEFDVSPFITKSVPIWVNKITGAKLPIVAPYTVPAGYEVGYSGVNLTWDDPSGAWSTLRLVRNSYGFPVDADDGDVLIEAPDLSAPTTYADVNLIQGRTYYYSIFVQETATPKTWVRAGNAYGIAVKDFGSYQKMYRYLPEVLRSISLDEITDDKENKDLQDLLKLLAFEYDYEKTLATNTMYSYDTTFVDGRYIPQMMKQFGLTFEPEVGIKQARILLRNALKIYKNKGSRDGLTTYLKAFTGYDTVLTVGKNLFLDFNCSSFEEGIGFWKSEQATLARQIKTALVSPYLEASSPANFPNSTEGMLKVTVATAGTVTLTCGKDAPVTKGIPVIPGEIYTFSVYGQTESVSKNASVSVEWFDIKGNSLGLSAYGTAVSLATNGWNVRAEVTDEAPVLASFAVPTIKITTTAVGNVFYFDAAQFEKASVVTAFEEARVLKIKFLASRINELNNPNFQLPGTWVLDNATSVLSSTLTGVPTKLGNSIVVRPTALSNVKVSSENVTTVTPGSTYTFSVYANYFNEGADPTTSDTVTAVIYWYNSAGTLIQTDTGTPAVYSTTSDWARPNVSGTAPATADYCVATALWTPSSLTVSLVLDEALLEQSSFVNSYFDGNTGVASLTNLFWEGTANASRSHYYRNRATVQARLLEDLPNYVTEGTKFQLYFAQP
jgi:hypothetical protein